MSTSGPVLRLFEVRTREGCDDELMKKFATTSAEVVQNEPGATRTDPTSRHSALCFTSLLQRLCLLDLFRESAILRACFGE